MAGQPLFVVPLDLGTLSTTSETAGHPVSHLTYLKSIGLTWKAASGSAFVRGNLGAAKDIDFCAILSANATSGTTFRLRLGTSQVEVDGTAPYDSGALPFISPSITRDDGLYHSFLTLPDVESATWWRIDIGGGPAGFETPLIVLGKKIVPARFYNYDWEAGGEDLGKMEWTRHGVPDELPGRKLRTVEFTLDWMTETEFETQFRPMAEAIGSTGMVYCCFDPEATAYRQNRTYYGKMRKPLVAKAKRIPTKRGMDFEVLSLI